MTAPAHTAEQIEAAFTSADCWALAHHLVTTYQGLIAVVLTDGTAAWDHALVYRAATDTYIDATGEHTYEDVQAAWENHDTWDRIETVRPGDFSDLTRDHPQIGVAEAVALLRSRGVDLGPARAG